MGLLTSSEHFFLPRADSSPGLKLGAARSVQAVVLGVCCQTAAGLLRFGSASTAATAPLPGGCRRTWGADLQSAAVGPNLGEHVGMCCYPQCAGWQIRKLKGKRI